MLHTEVKGWTISIIGVQAGGFAEGEALRIEQDNDDFTDVLGADGEVSRSATYDRRATVTLRLMQTSQINSALSAIRARDLATPGGAGVGPTIIRDRLGNSMYELAESWIAKPPDVSIGTQPSAREWKIRGLMSRRVDGGN